MNNLRSTFLVIAVYLFAANISFAASSSGLVNGVWFSEDPVTDFGQTTVFSVIHNQTEEKFQGIATLLVDGEAVGAQEISVSKDGIQKTAIPYEFSSGTHSVSMNFTAGNGVDVTFTELASKKIFVVKDTDGDGIQNTTDLDDDNDGIPDTEDAEPLVKNIIPKPTTDLSESGRSFLAKITGRGSDGGEEESIAKVDEEVQSVASTTNDLVAALLKLENARKKGAIALRGYEEARRQKLEEIALLEESLATTTGEFEPTNVQKSEKREHQIAAASAATFGTMLEKAWIFYAEILVLTLGVLHLLWGWFSRRFRNLGDDDEE